MAQTVCVIVSASDLVGLEAIVLDRNQPQKHAERARVVLASAAGDPVQRVAGVVGLLRDKTRKPGKLPIAAETVARVAALTCAAPPHEATHWTGRAMAQAAGVSLRSVQRIWAAHDLQPHRVRTF